MNRFSLADIIAIRVFMMLLLRLKGQMPLGQQVVFLLVLGLPIASVAWTVTHEDVFREPRDWCKRNSDCATGFARRKFFYLFTCEYCFSHYVATFFLFVTRFTLLYDGWRGYLISFFALVWVANMYMNIYARVRLVLKKDRVEIASHEKNLEEDELIERP